MADIWGEVARGFEPVREAFARNFADHGDVGAACTVYLRGTKVVDIWGGVADAGSGRPWEEDTLQLVFSTTKGVTAVCAHLLAERGELDLDAPVREYWPEFAAEGKEDVPVRWLLSHRAGLPVSDRPVAPADVYAWTPVADALAASRPVWEPGTQHGYHAVTFGFLVGEVVRRVSGRSLGTFFREEVAEPLGLDFWIGLPEELEARVAPLVQPPALGERGQVDIEALPEAVREMARRFLDPDGLAQRALRLTDPALNFNDREVHAAEIPAANGIGTARAVAKLYASLLGEVDGVRTLLPETVDRARGVESDGPDAVLGFPMRFGLGFMLASPTMPIFGPATFGHYGAGGSVGWADPDSGVAFAYVMNRMQQGLAGDQRTLGLMAALKSCAT